MLSQLSSFLRIGPIPSHNLSEQLLSWIIHRYTVHCCVHFHSDLSKKCFDPIAKLCMFRKKEKKIGHVDRTSNCKKLSKKLNSLVLLMKNAL